MSLVFRDGRLDDVRSVARLAAHSFPGARGSLREWEDTLLDSPHGGLETLWLGEEEGRVVAVCRLFRFQQWIGGRAIPTMGLGTVAISATARRRGLAGRLVESAFSHSRERGDVASALYPFRTSFYRRLGYGMAGEVHQYRIPLRSLPDNPLRSRVRLVESSADRAALASVYDQWAPLQTGQMARPARAWDLIWQGDTRYAALYLGPGGAPRGYLVFRYLTEPPGGARILEVEEFAALDDHARLGLHAWAGSLSDQWDQLVYRAHPEEGFPDHLSELRYATEGVPRWHFWFPEATILRGPMFRLLDLAGAWAARTIRHGPAMRLALEVQDDQVPENTGSWSLSMADGAVEIAKGPADGGVEATDLRLELGIEALSRIYMGALSVDAAVRRGLAKADGPERVDTLDALLRLPRPWTFDRF